MATTKSSVKASPGKVKAAARTKLAAKPGPAPAARLKVSPVVKATPATVAAKPARARAKKVAAIPLEQRRNYVEVAAYHIAERRGFTPGNPLEDWIQAEAEIDRLLAEGRLGV